MRLSSIVIVLSSLAIAIAVVAVSQPVAANGSDYTPVSEIDFALPGKPLGPLELANWWRSFGGRHSDARPPTPLIWSAARAASSQNHVDYLAWLDSIGSDYCGHGEDPAHPAPNSDRAHNVLFCGLSDLSRATDGWMETPLHGAPFVDPRSVAVGGAASERASSAGFEGGNSIDEPYVFPAPGGVYPLLEWLGGEIPDPTDDCPSDQRHGPPIHAFLPDYRVESGSSTATTSKWKVVSASLTTSSGAAVPACLMEWASQVGPGDAVGRSVYLFPKQPLVTGRTYRAAVTLDPAGLAGWDLAAGVTRVALDWRFTAVDWPEATRGPRLFDARSLVTDSPVEIPIADLTGVSADTVALHVVVVDPDQNGFVTVWPCERERPVAASMNYRAGASRGSTVIAKVDSGGSICVSTRTPTQLVVDFVGAFDGIYVGQTPRRVLDTRPGANQTGYSGPQPSASTVRLDLARHIKPGQSAGLTVAAVDPGGRGYVTVWPCDQPRPTAANLNYVAGQTVANAVIARPGADGQVCLYTLAAAHLVADLGGVVGNGYRGRSPTRVLDTRERGRPGAGSVTVLDPGTPSAQAVALNVAAVDTGDRGYLTVWPCDRPRPATSTLNYVARAVVPNLVISEVAGDGTVCIFSRAATDIVIDLQGEIG